MLKLIKTGSEWENKKVNYYEMKIKYLHEISDEKNI